MTEGAEQNPISPYGSSKLMVERMLADYGAAYGINSIALRYFNAAGADPEWRDRRGARPRDSSDPAVVGCGSPNTHRLHRYSDDDYDTPDGTCIRDYVHVSDLADAHVLGVEEAAATRMVAMPTTWEPAKGSRWPRSSMPPNGSLGERIPVVDGRRRVWRPRNALIACATRARERTWLAAALLVDSAHDRHRVELVSAALAGRR